MNACTCRETPRERFENPDCPVHGWRETARRMGRDPAIIELQRRLDARPLATMTDAELEGEFVRLLGSVDRGAKQAIVEQMQEMILQQPAG